mmetsp:Transcript_51683/g.113288  ORF Transcript_51683/g.113288 Transcript_51683/m.113288 type:complete len:217 (-) Transcript_51683:325-975(-)
MRGQSQSGCTRMRGRRPPLGRPSAAPAAAGASAMISWSPLRATATTDRDHWRVIAPGTTTSTGAEATSRATQITTATTRRPTKASGAPTSPTTTEWTAGACRSSARPTMIPRSMPAARRTCVGGIPSSRSSSGSGRKTSSCHRQPPEARHPTSAGIRWRASGDTGCPPRRWWRFHRSRPSCSPWLGRLVRVAVQHGQRPSLSRWAPSSSPAWARGP